MGFQALAKVASEYDGEEDGSLLGERSNGNTFSVLAHGFVEDTLILTTDKMMETHTVCRKSNDPLFSAFITVQKPQIPNQTLLTNENPKHPSRCALLQDDAKIYQNQYLECQVQPHNNGALSSCLHSVRD